MTAPFIIVLALVLPALMVTSFGVVVPTRHFRGAPSTNHYRLQPAPQVHHSTLFASPDESQSSSTPLIDLQTFLKLCGLAQTGGEAKALIQGGERVLLNGEIETRRAKKLFPGDQVSFGDTTLDVSDEVAHRGYVYKAKKKKAKPRATVDADGNLEFGGRFRSEEWRAERKQKKAERKEKKSKKE